MKKTTNLIFWAIFAFIVLSLFVVPVSASGYPPPVQTPVPTPVPNPTAPVDWVFLAQVVFPLLWVVVGWGLRWGWMELGKRDPKLQELLWEATSTAVRAVEQVAAANGWGSKEKRDQAIAWAMDYLRTLGVSNVSVAVIGMLVEAVVKLYYGHDGENPAEGEQK